MIFRYLIILDIWLFWIFGFLDIWLFWISDYFGDLIFWISDYLCNKIKIIQYSSRSSSTPACFGTSVKFSRNLLKERNRSSRCQSRYWLPSLTLSWCDNVKIPQYIKLGNSSTVPWHQNHMIVHLIIRKLIADYILTGARIHTSASVYVVCFPTRYTACSIWMRSIWITYSHAPHNDVSVSSVLHIQWWSLL
jgi:hypothetical protein